MSLCIDCGCWVPPETDTGYDAEGLCPMCAAEVDAEENLREWEPQEMILDNRGDIYTLSTGRTFYANNGILGLSPDGRVHGGYDDDVDTDGWTDEERHELANAMIERWRRWQGSRKER